MKIIVTCEIVIFVGTYLVMSTLDAENATEHSATMSRDYYNEYLNAHPMMRLNDILEWPEGLA